MEYETLRFFSWTSFRIIGVLILYYLLSTLDIFFGSLVIILVAFPAAIIFYHIPPPPKATVQKVFAKLDNIKVGAHRAGCLDAPENSLAALYKANELGCKLVEFDLSFTADDQAVIFHDYTVDRISDGSGVLESMTWAEVKKLDINAKHPNKSQFAVTRVALLSEMVEECLRLDLLFIIDIKCYDVRAVSAVLALYEKFPKMYEMALISSFNPQVIYEIRRQQPQVVACMAWRPHICTYASYSVQQGPAQPRFSNPLTHVAASAVDAVAPLLYTSVMPYLLGLSVLLLEKDCITYHTVNRTKEKDLRLVAWTVNQPDQKAFLAEYLRVPYLTDLLAGDKHLVVEK